VTDVRAEHRRRPLVPEFSFTRLQSGTFVRELLERGEQESARPARRGTAPRSPRHDGLQSRREGRRPADCRRDRGAARPQRTTRPRQQLPPRPADDAPSHTEGLGETI
jgi:hypothetical protein